MEKHKSWVILEKLHGNWIHMSFPWIKNLGLNNKSTNVLGFRMEPIPDTSASQPVSSKRSGHME
jgi:hypothetical protein